MNNYILKCMNNLWYIFWSYYEDVIYLYFLVGMSFKNIFKIRLKEKKINWIIMVNLKSFYLWKSYFIYYFFKYLVIKNKIYIKIRNVYLLFF